MTDCNKVIKDIEYAKDLLQNRPEQDTVDYKVYEVLDDALDLIHDLQSQIAMLVVAQHELCEMMNKGVQRLKNQIAEYAVRVIANIITNHENQQSVEVIFVMNGR